MSAVSHMRSKCSATASSVRAKGQRSATLRRGWNSRRLSLLIRAVLAGVFGYRPGVRGTVSSAFRVWRMMDRLGIDPRLARREVRRSGRLRRAPMCPLRPQGIVRAMAAGPTRRRQPLLPEFRAIREASFGAPGPHGTAPVAIDESGEMAMGYVTAQIVFVVALALGVVMLLVSMNAARSGARLQRMMDRLGIDPRLARREVRRSGRLRRAVRRCARCGRKGLCAQ